LIFPRSRDEQPPFGFHDESGGMAVRLEGGETAGAFDGGNVEELGEFQSVAAAFDEWIDEGWVRG
jgi:hypothetical protein